MNFIPNVNITMKEYNKLIAIKKDFFNFINGTYCDGYNYYVSREDIIKIVRKYFYDSNIISEKDRIGLIIEGADIPSQVES